MENVNLRITECEELYQKMQEYHKNQQETFTKGLNDIRQLLSGAEGFYANQTNEKVLLVMGQLDGQIVPQLTQLFAEGEEACKKMLEKATAEDVQG